MSNQVPVSFYCSPYVVIDEAVTKRAIPIREWMGVHLKVKKICLISPKTDKAIGVSSGETE
jgi:hypothetical protein